jgi:carbohydrate kinase (thermoresistant glucokinase family)
VIVIVMGVMGSGKTTVGKKLAESLDCPFFDADDFHPAANKEKMSRGVSLTDVDRQPWLENLAVLSLNWNRHYSKVILACSALKQRYRNLLSSGLPVKWVYLRGEMELIRERLESRPGHFASLEILGDQFAALEEPKDAVVVDIRESPDKIVEGLNAQLEG